MPTIDEVRFPTDIARGAVSVPRRALDQVRLKSGFVVRNTRWAASLRSYDIGLGIRDMTDLYTVIQFWEAREGGLRGFRFKDWADYKSAGPTEATSDTDQAMAQITSTTYQLQKTYSDTANSVTREINKIVQNTIKVRDDTGSLTQGTDYTVDLDTGIVTFSTAPTGTPTAGFEFDVPVWFEGATLDVNISQFNQGSVPDITLEEIRL